MIVYVHPFFAALVLALLGYVASLGIRARNDRRHAAGFLRRHAQIAPYMYALVLVTWVAGLTTTWLLRPELHLATSWHFRIGAALVALLSASALSSRYLDRPVVRSIHPWFGAAALLVAAAQVVWGLQIMK